MSGKIAAVLVRTPAILVIDLALLNAAYGAALVLLSGFPPNAAGSAAFRLLLPVLNSMAVITFHLVDLYGEWWRRSQSELAYSLAVGLGGTALAGLAAAIVMLHGIRFPRLVVLLAAPLQEVMLLFFRSRLQACYLRNAKPQRLLVVADDYDSARLMAEKVIGGAFHLYTLHAVVASHNLDDLNQQLPSADLVAVDQSAANKAVVISQSVRMRKHTLLVPHVADLFVLNAAARSLDDALLLYIKPMQLRPVQRFVKRVADVLGACLGLIVATPVLLAIYILIPLTSRGSAIYRQERLGRDGRPYTLLKFRTMIAEAEQSSGPVLAIANDPRVTRLGKILRATRMDELPQLINVLRGEMSLVGPRPERAFFARQFEQQMPAYALRLAVKPGISGLAQVMGRYTTSTEHKLRFDLNYIANCSLLLDLQILFRTVAVVLQADKARGMKSVPSSAPASVSRTLENIGKGSIRQVPAGARDSGVGGICV